MRLIDADALLNSGFPTVYHTEFGDEVINTEDIKNAPTVERPKGKWIPVDCQECDKYNHEDHFCPTWCETIKKTSEDLQQTYQKELDKLEKIRKMCEDAFSNPETLDPDMHRVNMYRSQTLAKIYQLFIYDQQ